MNSKQIILIAGVPRSGSTWLFNAVRRILEEADVKFHSTWISSWDRNNPASTHLVKIHNPTDLDFDADFVFTTHRPTANCLASLIRMGWLEPEPESIRVRWKSHEELYAYWKKRSTLEIMYDEIMNRPHYALNQLAGELNIQLSDSCMNRIAVELLQMKAPDEGSYDPATLLHPRHRKSGAAEGLTPEDIEAMVTD